MKLAHIDLGKLSVSKANMRAAKKPPDISDILPSIRARGVLVPLLVRPNGSDDSFEIVAGRRRFHAALAVAAEAGGDDADAAQLPCAIIEAGDDAAALEASLIENIARLDPDEVTQWETFTRLVKQGRSVEHISATFGLPPLTIRRVLALGNLLPRIRALYAKEKIDPATVRHLTMASKERQTEWLGLYDDPEAYVPTGHQLKAWLFGGASIPTKAALFDLADYKGAVVADLFGEDGYFADADQFFEAQMAEVERRRAAYLEAGWSEVRILSPGEHFDSWNHERRTKAKGGRVYIVVSPRGDVAFHEGYVTRAEARKLDRGEAPAAEKPKRSEVTSSLQDYIDLHRHAALRLALTGQPSVALRLMAAHAIAGSTLWSVRVEPQTSRNEAVTESVECCAAEARFDERRRAVLDLLGLDPEKPTVAGGHGGDHGLATLFLRLLDLPDPALMDVIAVVMGETLSATSAAVEAAGTALALDMADHWQADDAFFDLIRDRELLGRIVAEVAGEAVAKANAGEKAKPLKAIIRDCLAGGNGRAKVEAWVPRFMAFPPDAYTARGGVANVARARMVAQIAAEPDDRPDPAGPGAADESGAANEGGAANERDMPEPAADEEGAGAGAPEPQAEPLAA